MTAGASRPPQAADARRTGRRRRRPTGAPPPLPHHIERSGLVWLAVTVAATVAAIGIFAGALTGWAVDVTVFDDAVTRRVVQAPVPGLTGFAHAVAEAGSAPAIIFVAYALLLALIVLRRFRHLLALLIGYYALILVTTIFQLIVHRLIDDGVIDDGLLMIRKMWDAGLAHRDIKPANLLVRDGHLLLIDVAFAEVRPTPWREAVDLGNMMLCLALRGSADRVYTRALRHFTVEEISEALAADQGLAVPGQLRQALRDSGSDVREQFLRLLPRRPAPIRVQHWSARRVSMWAALLLAVLLLGVSISQNLINNATPATALNVSTVSCQAVEPLLAEAQSVPSASMLACVRSLPLGWSLGSIQAQNGRSVISLDNDRAGPGSLAMTLAARCVRGRAGPARSPRPGVRRFRAADRGTGFEATWFDVFPGGCVTIALRPGTNAAAIDRGLPGQVLPIVSYVPRAALQHELAQQSGGRLSLSQRPSA